MTAHRLRLLTVNPAEHPRGQAHLAAASGLVCAHGRVYVMGDDEQHLVVFNDRRSAGHLHRVRSGHLPAHAAQRKRVKPDFESLLLLPARGRPRRGTGAPYRNGRGVTERAL